MRGGEGGGGCGLRQVIYCVYKFHIYKGPTPPPRNCPRPYSNHLDPNNGILATPTPSTDLEIDRVLLLEVGVPKTLV